MTATGGPAPAPAPSLTSGALQSNPSCKPMLELLLVEPQERLIGRVVNDLAVEGYRLRHLRNGLSALLALRDQPWPLAILLANDLPDVSGLEVCRSLRAFGYGGHLLLLLHHEQAGQRVAGLDAGADGVLETPFRADELAAMLRAQTRRFSMERPAPGGLDWIAAIGGGSRQAPLPRARQNPLTPREQDVLEQMVLGLGNAEIADRLFLSNETVKTHVRNLMGKLKARHRTQAVVVALQNGYCQLPEAGSGPSDRPKLVGWS